MLSRVYPYIVFSFMERGKTMDRNSKKTALKPACLSAWRLAAAVAAAFSIATSAVAQSSWRTAAGAVKKSASSAPVVSASASKDGTQTLVYRFAAPLVSVAADGVADIALAGVANDGLPGQPLMPCMTVRIAIPQGRTAKGVRVVPGELATVAEGVTLRHAEREFHPGKTPVPTPRDAAVYASADPFPASPSSEGRTSWKNGVAFYEFNLSPVVYVPATGVVSAYRDISVTLTLAPARLRVGAPVDTDHAPFISAERARVVGELVDNPAVVAGYEAAAPSRLKAAPAVSAVSSVVYAPPALPCSSSESYDHVVITGESLTNAFQSLVQYRRKRGVASTMVTVEDIMKAYGHSGDRQFTIREFIKDAYATWGVEYVVLGGDTSIIPVRGLHCESGLGDVDEIPSDLYYQCLDGDFDGNGNGTYGEPDDGPNGTDVDLFPEVKIGRVSVETEKEFQNWFYKMCKYDADCAAGAPYTRAALFVGEFVGPYDNCYAKPVLEQIRIGTAYTGFNDSRSAWGFMDVPDLFDADSLSTLYDADGEWSKEQLAGALVAGDGVSVVNHFGHSEYNYNMKLYNSDVDALRNETPFFVYSQGCIAGALDKDCIAEHFTTSTRYGAFAGVWNARYGWYSYGDSGVSNEGSSIRLQRCFWDAVFNPAQEHREIGYANMVSHEVNAGKSHKNGTMRWVYFETNLFGDPIQSLCGEASGLTLDREAYRSDATARVTYFGPDPETDTIDVVFSAARRYWHAWTNQYVLVNIPVANATVSLPRVGEYGDGLVCFEAEVKLSDFVLEPPDKISWHVYTNALGKISYVRQTYTNALGEISWLGERRLQHDDVFTVSLAEGRASDASAYIDDVAPGFADVRLRNGDEGVASVIWKTYTRDKSDPDRQPAVFLYEDTTGSCFMDVTVPFTDPLSSDDAQYVTSHTAHFDVTNGLYYVRILAVDKAGNSNVWNSVSVSPDIEPADKTEYGRLIVAPRELRTDYDMERDASGWTVSADNDGCWQLGVPTYGPENATRCWGTVLDGRYPDGASAWLVSPEIKLRDSPLIEFRQWYDIQASPLGKSNNAEADCGVIEIIATGSDGTHADMSIVDGAWHNAAPFAMKEIPNGLVQGTSEGWETVRLILPEEYAGKTIRLRFRFVSDTYPRSQYPADYPAANVGNPAGWYIDSVKFYDVPSVPGVVLSVLDSDGEPVTIVRPGETTTLTLSSFNVSYDTLFPAGDTSVALSVPSVASGKVVFADGSPASLTYGSIPACTAKTAAETLDLSVDASVPAGTPITLTQTIVLDSGATLESTARLRVGVIGEVSGTVVQPDRDGLPTPNPVAGATVVVNASEGDYVCTTGGDGAFSFEGIASNRIVRITASYGFATANAVAVAPASDVVIELPLAEFGLSTNEFYLACQDTDPVITNNTAFVISNVFVLAAEDGNEGPSCDLEYEITGFVDDAGNSPPWFTLRTPPTGSIAPGESLPLDIVLDPSQADPSAPQSVILTIGSNGWNIRSANVTVTLDVTADISLDPFSAEATDDFDPEPVDENGDSPEPSNDGDGFLEPGELGQVWFTVYNPSIYETIDSFEATVTVLSGNAEIITDPPYTNYPAGDTVSWFEIPPQAAAKCALPITVRLNDDVGDGDVVEFLVEGPAIHGDTVNEQSLHFFITNTVKVAVDGAVLAENLFPAQPVGEINGVNGARVTATDANGNVFYSNYTPSNGVYAITGLTPNEKYWISTTVAAGSKFVPPFAQCITPDSDTYSLDIVGTTYGPDAGHLRLESVAVFGVGRNDSYVTAGDTVFLIPTVRNDASLPVRTLRAHLSLPNEFERSDCMSIVLVDNLDLSTDIVPGGESYVLPAFVVTVDPAAVAGDYQRFLLEVWEETDDDEPKRWFFDFKVEVNPRCTISGTVLTSSSDALPGVTVAARGLDVSYSATATANATMGGYGFVVPPNGTYEVSVVAAPGYIVNPPAITANVFSASIDGLDFTLEPWTITPAADFYVPGADGGTGSFALEIPEGVSTNVSFQIANGGDEDANVTVSITYHRQVSELLPPESIAASVAEARAAVARAAGGDWNMTDAKSFSHTEYEFVFKDGTSPAARDAYLSSRGFTATYHFKTIPASIATPAGGTAAALSTAALSSPATAFATGGDDGILVSAQPAVLGAVADAVVPDDPRYAEQWALANDRQTGGTRLADIGAEDAWEFAQTTGSRDVLVAVTDTGIFYTHPDLAANMYGKRLGWNYVDNNGNCSDAQGHGTHVAGIIGAVGNNGLGVCGVNWKVSLMAQRVSTDPRGAINATSADIARSFEDAYLAGASINNNSWGGPFYSDVLYRVMKKAQDYDMLFVCAAGNDAKDVTVSLNYPASMSQWLDNVIVVAASDHDGRIAEFSNYSPSAVHLAAPGVDILSTAISESNGALGNGALVPDGNYVVMSGTSMATPYVSGAAAFLKAVVPTASYGFIRDALLQSVRKDPLLADYVSTSGHLDLSGAVRILGSQWLRFADSETVVVTTNVTIPAATSGIPGSVDLSLLVNDPATLRAGEYIADVKIEGELTSVSIPFELTVTPAAIVDIDAVEIFDEEAKDGLASRGEEVTLSITVRNVGTLEFEDLKAELVAANGGEVLEADWDYGFVSGLDISMPGMFKVKLPASGDTAEFTLKLTSEDAVVAELPVSIALFDGSILTVTVVDASGAAVTNANAAVEILGAGAGRGVTDTNGVARIVAPTASGSYTLRVFADGFVRYEGSVDPSDGEVTVTLGNATLEPAETVLDIHVPEGMSLTTNLVLSASNLTSSVAIKPAERARVAVFDDRDDSAFLVSRLEGMGFDVDYFPSNYIYTAYNYGPSEYAEIVRAARYTWDDALIFPYDAVIAVLSGANGSGRLLAPLEQQAFADYVERGGRVIFSGTTPLARPDNVELADLVGLTPDACEVASVATIAALAAEDGLGAPFVSLSSNDVFAVDSGDYDASFKTNFVSGASAATMDGDKAVSKVYLSERSDLDGQAVLWNGNATDWQRDGAALDVLRGYLYNEFVASNSPSWLAVSDETLAIADATDGELALTLNPERTLGAGTYEATVLLMADVDGAQCVPVTVILTVDPPTLRALSGAVTDAGGRPLVGDGGTGSCIVQLIYAGPDGIPDPPAADGSATGDDMILAASGTGLGFARFGEGVAADSGTFDALFNLSFDGFVVGAEGFGFYARAWDAPSAAAAVAYGDSGVSNVIYEAGLPQPIDFGSWALTNAVAGPLSDANGDGIPDAWILAYRPDLDPRAPIEPLDTEIVCETNDFIQTAAPPSNYSNADGNPARVFVTDKFVFVLEQFTHRIAVYDRAARTNLFYYGATYDAKNNTNGGNTPGTNYTDTAKWAFGTGEGGFKQPFGMALDTFTGQNRFAVADTENSRIQLFYFDTETGSITNLAVYGTPSTTPGIGAPDGTFSKPQAIAFMPGNDLLIADTGNYRVARVNYNNGTWTWRKTFQFTDKSLLSGICYGKDNLAGFWVADAGKTLQRVSFHHISNFSETPVVSLGNGNPDSGDFTTPRDVQLWTIGDRVRIAATDHQGSRIRILDPLANASGAYTGLVAVADIGSASDASLQRHQQLWRPVGVFPVSDTNLLYVADTGHNMVKWYGFTIDADGDGMDDLWEDMNGLDSTRDDAQEDADGDGLPNIGEYRADTDPQKTDSDGDGAGDLYEMYQPTDPLDDESTPPPGAKFRAIAANPESIHVGQSVTITVNLDRAIEGAAQLKLYTADGICFVSDALAVNGATATYTYTADGAVLGSVDAKFIFAGCDPPATNVVALFEILARLGSVKTFDAATGVATNLFTYGSTVRIVATFDAPVPGGEIALVGTNGVTLASGAMTVSGDTLVFEWTTSADYIGPVAATLTVPYCDPSEKTYATLFVVVDPEGPEPPVPPAEEYEEVRWHIDSIAVADTVSTLTWTLPQENLPASGECTFRIEYRTSLTAGAWAKLDDSLSATSAADCAYEVDLSALGTPPSLFLRLFWTNKVK